MNTVIHTPMLEQINAADIFLAEGFTKSGKSEFLDELKKQLMVQDVSVLYFSLETDRWQERWRTTDRFIASLPQNEDIYQKTTYILFDDIHKLPTPELFLYEVYKKVSLLGTLPSQRLHIVATTGLRLFNTVQTKKIAAEHPGIRLQAIMQNSVDWQVLLHDHFPDMTEFGKKYALDDTAGLSAIHAILETPDIKKFCHDELLPHLHQLGKKRLPEQRVHESEYNQLLKYHFDNLLIEHSTLKKAFDLLAILPYLTSRISKTIKVSDIATATGLKRSFLNKKLSLLEASFLFSYVPPFFTDTRYETSKQNVIYTNDYRFIPTLLGENAPTLSDIALRYNVVYSQLLAQVPFESLYWYRTTIGKYLPFIIKKGDQFIAIDVERAHGDEYAASLSALKTFLRRYRDHIDTAMLVTDDTYDPTGTPVKIPLLMLPFVKL